MNIISDFIEFCLIGMFSIQIIILWALLTIDRELKQVKKDIEGWVK